MAQAPCLVDGPPEGAPLEADDAGPAREAVLGGLRTMWRLPGRGPPRAVLFIAHGMCHGAEDFFGEPGFAGLPVEQRIIEAALSRGFLPVAASSTDRRRKAWLPPVDGPKVANLLQELYQRESLSADLPCCALGISRGGAFSLQLGTWTPLRAIVCQIMAVPPEVLLQVPQLAPVLFVHMPRDDRTAAGVQSCIEELHGHGGVAEELRCCEIPIGPTFFTEHCGIPVSASKAMSALLRDNGFVDGTTGLLRKDPRASSWRDVLRPIAEELGDSLVADRSPIAEVMNVAFASHEITAEGIEQALEFCEKHLP